jgi:hypothetical protein
VTPGKKLPYSDKVAAYQGRHVIECCAVLDDEEKKIRARQKFTPDNGPMREETKEILRVKLKEWHRKHRRGTEMGNALARKARRFRKIPVVG